MARDERVWFHAIVSTYGAWLFGDARGFRTRHHREHVEGDYKQRPPKGRYASQEKRSRESLKQEPVVIPPPLRRFVGEALHEKLTGLGAWVLIEAVSGQHVHMLVKLPPRFVRTWIGKAKMHTSFVLKKHQWHGKVWGVRCRAERVRDRAHQQNAFGYIRRHADEGAWVGVWMEDPAGDQRDGGAGD